MQGRICPHCFTRWYSSDSSTVWKCESCGHNIPVPKNEDKNKKGVTTY
jgi:ribosomal protein L37AE/L43A